MRAEGFILKIYFRIKKKIKSSYFNELLLRKLLPLLSSATCRNGSLRIAMSIVAEIYIDISREVPRYYHETRRRREKERERTTEKR